MHQDQKTAPRPQNDSPWPALSLLFFAATPALLLIYGYQACGDADLLFKVTFFSYFGYGIAVSLVVLALALSALKARDAGRRQPRLPPSRVSVAVPVHDEAAVIRACVESLLTQKPTLEQVIVVNDGSTDRTLDALVAAFVLRPDDSAGPRQPGVRRYLRSDRWPNLLVIDSEHGGKARALNRALAASHGEIFVTADGDCVFPEGSIERMAAHIDSDTRIVAAGGVVVAANGVPREGLTDEQAALPAGLLTKLQWIEYGIGFVWRFGWGRLNTLLLLSGSFSAFRSESLRACGGFDPKSLTEDYQIAYRLHLHCLRHGIDYRIVSVPDSTVYTLVPETLVSLFQQRCRWFQGFLQTLLRYRGFVFDSRYGWLGLFMLPVKCVDALVPLWGLYLYSALAYHILADSFSIPVSGCLFVGLLGLRFGTELLTSWVFLALRQSRISPLIARRDLWLLFGLTPLFLIFNRPFWLFYSLAAHLRLWIGGRRWVKASRRGFGAARG